MNKAELVAAIAEKTDFSKKDSEKALKAFIDVVTEELTKGEKVQLVGIAASKAPKFKAGKALKDVINA
ncbi:MAG: histone family protein DNA-binding protein [Herbinix sp.]|nr:histone family protein DNA-binding protein [Herbinix sp.]